MAIQVFLHHKTVYSYDKPVQLGPHVVRLRPAPHCRTPIRAYSLQVGPAGHFLNWQQDPFGNYLARLVFPRTGALVRGRGRSRRRDDGHQPVRLLPRRRGRASSRSRTSRAARASSRLTCELGPGGPKLAASCAASSTTSRRRGGARSTSWSTSTAACRRRSATTSAWSRACTRPRRRSTRGHGSCRDSAWLLVQVLRRLGLAARFVSGYSIQLEADVKALDGPSGVDAGLHRPARLGRGVPAGRRLGRPRRHDRPAGRRGAHPARLHARSRQRGADHRLLRLARRRSADEEVKASFRFEMSVARMHEEPRVTKPYTEEQWAAIERAGPAGRRRARRGRRAADDGRRADVRVDRRPRRRRVEHRRARARRSGKLREQLLHRLSANASRPAALLHYGQGKWYPGEPLPRWALGCYWRNDGVPIWHNPALFAREGASTADATTRRRSRSRAAWRAGSASTTSSSRPATRTSATTCGASDGCRSTSTRSTSRLDDVAERARLARVFEQGLGHVVGYALPLQPVSDWSDRRACAGEAARGPCAASTCSSSPATRRWAIACRSTRCRGRRPRTADVLDELGPLRAAPRRCRSRAQKRPRRAAETRRPATTDAPLERRARRRAPIGACVRTRAVRRAARRPPARLPAAAAPARGLPRSRAPPSRTTAARAATCRVRIEGYQPPADPRLEQLRSHARSRRHRGQHPPGARRGSELRRATRRSSTRRRGRPRLGTEKFMLDGRHAGTGGGNHVVLGGADAGRQPDPAPARPARAAWSATGTITRRCRTCSPACSSARPARRRGSTRPATTASTSWRSPSGSSPERGQAVRRRPGWSTASFRNLLIDVTGNTHRAEFCIDKLYTPDSADGPPAAWSSCAPSRCRRTRA